MTKKGTRLENRYPDIGFFLSFFPYKPALLSKDSKPLEKWLAKLDLGEIEVLYLIGLFDFFLPKEIENWLKGKKERALVFVENDLGAIASFDKHQFFENPQIHLIYAQENPIEELAETFPTDRIAIFSGKEFDCLQLERRSAALSALYSDVLYSHKIVENVVHNFSRLGMCFQAGQNFQNTPAIICGAGPSLEKSFPILQEAKKKALLFACGSAITALTKNGITPHFALALDPNEEEFERLQQSYYFEGPFLFAPRLYHLVFSTANGPFGYVKTDTGGLLEHWLEEKLQFEGKPIGPELGSEAFSSTTLAVAYATAIGCNPIIFVGLDLSYQNNKRYALGVDAKSKKLPGALEKSLLRKDIFGETTETSLKWVMESEAIGNFAKKKEKTQFFNATEGGIGFLNIENKSLNQILIHLKTQDLCGKVHASVQEAKSLPIDSLSENFEQIILSLKRCETYCSQILLELKKEKSSGKLALYQSELAEEIAYYALLEGINLALDRILFRYFPSILPEEGKKNREIAKYQELNRQVEKLLKIFHTRPYCKTYEFSK